MLWSFKIIYTFFSYKAIFKTIMSKMLRRIKYKKQLVISLRRKINVNRINEVKNNSYKILFIDSVNNKQFKILWISWMNYFLLKMYKLSKNN